MSFSNLSVKAKLLAGFGSLALAVSCVSAVALSALGSSHEDFSSYIAEDAVRISLANDVLDAANARAIGARNLVLVATSADREAEKAAVTQAHAKLQDVIARRRTEVSALTRAIAEQGTAAGVPTPALTTMAALIEAIESHYDDQLFPEPVKA